MRFYLSSLLFSFCLTFASFCYSIETDYSLFKSIDEIIEHETCCIANTSPNDYGKLADGYISRGESYLLSENYETALSDFHRGYLLAFHCKDDESRILFIRSLFGAALSLEFLDRLGEIEIIKEEIYALLESCKCIDCHESHACQRIPTPKNRASIYLTSNESCPILGPDHISIDECINRVNATEYSAKLLK